MSKNTMTRPPLLLEDFESARASSEGSGRRWGSRGEKTYATVSVVDKQNHPDAVRNGNRALKFDYDFRYETTEGGSRRAYFNTYAGDDLYPGLETDIRKDPAALIIPDGAYPTHLGMWVYGDANYAWFNGMLIDADGNEVEITCGDLDWVGWKFIVMDIPPNLKLPFYVAYPARMLTGNQTIHGMLYIDDIMAVYGGIDFDALPPTVSDYSCRELPSGRAGFPVLGALLSDPDDLENNCPASGIDPDRTEVYIDGVRHKKSMVFTPQGNDVRMELLPDFPLCGGPHKLDIAVSDRAGNVSRVPLFFEVRSNAPGIALTADQSAQFGGHFRCRLTMDNAANDTKGNFTLKYDPAVLTPSGEFATPSQGVALTATIEAATVTVDFDTQAIGGRLDLGTLTFTAASALGAPATTALICESARLEREGKAEPFCFADITAVIEPGLCLSVERLCGGYDTLFTVTDAQGEPIAGARVINRRADTAYLGQTDAAGRLTVPGVAAVPVGTQLDLYARADNRFSVTSRHTVSNDLGLLYPENINVTSGKNCAELFVTWQTGVAVTEGYIQYAKKTPAQTQLTEADAFCAARRRNSVSTHRDASCEMIGFSVRLQDLEPGAEYLYRVGAGDYWSETKVLKTVPAAGEFVFAVLADTHNVCGEAMRAALKQSPDIAFFTHAGDFVSAGGVYDDWQAYFRDADGLHAVYPTVAVSGNHDLSDGTGANYRLTHAYPVNGVTGAPEGLYYYTELNNTLFLSLGGGFEDDRAIMDWISDTVRNTAMTWKVVLVHEGPYTCYINAMSEEIKWGTYFNTAGIDLLISGHDHTYQRATIKDHQTLDVDRVVASADGVTYLQSGTSGGASHHNWEKHRPIWNAVYDSKTPSVSILRVTDEKIEVTALCVADNAAGYEVFDSFEVVK